MRVRRILAVVLCCAFAAACAKSFRPTTPEEQAVARIMRDVQAALRTGDKATLARLFTPDATVVITNERDQGSEKPWRSAVQQHGSVLRIGVNDPLFNFRQPTPQQALLESTSETAVDARSYTENKHIRWELRQTNGWQVERVSATIWTFPIPPRGSGP